MIRPYSCLIFLFLGFACSPKQEDQRLQQEVVSNLANHVVIPTYAGLYEAAKILQERIHSLSTGDAAQLDQARVAWLDARQYWEQSEAFLFGPVDYEEIDPALDSWPADVQAISEILSSASTITDTLIAQNSEARGFHLIEFLLWGAAGDKTSEKLSERELVYLKAAVDDFVANSKRLHESWAVGDAAFVHTLTQVSNSHYDSYQEVIEEFLEGMIAIADEVANEKISGPLNEDGGQPELDQQESYFSDNSKNDLINNIISIEQIYLGTFDTHSGKGLSALVVERDTAIDEEVKAKIAEAKIALSQLPDSFNEALFNNREEIAAAKQVVLALHAVLDNKVKSLLLK